MSRPLGVLLLGVDVGNTNVKCVALSAEIGVVRVITIPTAAARSERHGGALHMDGLWRIVCHAVRAVLAEVTDAFADVRVGGIAVSSAGCETVLLDRGGAVIPGARAGGDGGTLYRRYQEDPGPEGFFSTTGYPLEPHSAPFLVARLREADPSAFDRIDCVLSISGYLTYRLTGQRAFEPSLIGSLAVREAGSGRFWSDLLADLPLDPSRFGREVPSGGLVGEVTADAAVESGLPVGASVFAGAHDYLSAAFATGPWLGNAVLDVLGTWEIIATFHDRPRSSPSPEGLRGFVDTHVAGDRYSYMIEALAGGRMHWFRELVSPPFPATAAAHSPGSASGSAGRAREAVPLYFPGRLTGPGMGALVGLESGHTRADLLDSVFLGLTFLTAGAFQEQAALAPGTSSICAVGGMSANGSWMQTKADVLGLPVVVPQVPEATASGAALLAGVGAGVFTGYEDAASALSTTTTVLYEPDAHRHERFGELYESTYRPLQLALSEPVPARS